MWVNLDQQCTAGRMDATIEKLCPMDITITGDPSVPDGVYRRCTPEFLGWMRERLERAKTRKLPAADIDAAEGFYERLVVASGMTPVSPPCGYIGPKVCTISTDWS